MSSFKPNTHHNSITFLPCSLCGLVSFKEIAFLTWFHVCLQNSWKVNVLEDIAIFPRNYAIFCAWSNTIISYCCSCCTVRVFSFESELWISTATKSIITPSFSRLLFQVFTILMTHSRCYYCKHKTLRYFCLLQTATRLLWSTCDRCGWPNGWTTRTNMVSAFSCQIEELVYFSMTPHACCLHQTESTFVLL